MQRSCPRVFRPCLDFTLVQTYPHSLPVLILIKIKIISVMSVLASGLLQRVAGMMPISFHISFFLVIGGKVFDYLIIECLIIGETQQGRILKSAI